MASIYAYFYVGFQISVYNEERVFIKIQGALVIQGMVGFFFYAPDSSELNPIQRIGQITRIERTQIFREAR